MERASELSELEQPRVAFLGEGPTLNWQVAMLER